MNLSSEDVEKTNQIAKALISHLMLGTCPKQNEAHKIAPAPVCIWEEHFTCDIEHHGKDNGPTGPSCYKGVI